MGAPQLYELNPIIRSFGDSYQNFYHNYTPIIAKIFLFIIPIFYILSKIDDIKYIKNNSESENKLNRYRFNIILYISYVLYVIYMLYNASDSFGGQLGLLLYYFITIIIYSSHIYSVHQKKNTYTNYSFNEKVVLYSLIFLIIYNSLGFLVSYIPTYEHYIYHENKRLRKIYKEQSNSKKI
tara:strand:+ start:428 stop:970 length:543 start_codon:yes stop_codon:yes gene_type:complete